MTGATCTASEQYSQQSACSKALDGKTNTEWETRAGKGIWIEVNLPKGESRTISKIGLMNRAAG